MRWNPTLAQCANAIKFPFLLHADILRSEHEFPFRIEHEFMGPFSSSIHKRRERSIEHIGSGNQIPRPTDDQIAIMHTDDRADSEIYINQRRAVEWIDGDGTQIGRAH